MKEKYVPYLFKDGVCVGSLRACDLKKDAIALAESAETDFDHAEVKTIYVRNVKGGE